MAAQGRMAYTGAGAAPGASARDQLFEQPRTGAPPPAPSSWASPAPGAPRFPAKEDVPYMDSRQLMDAAVEQHKDTTATARRALGVVAQTQELQASTLGALQDQDAQMRRVAAGMDRIGTDLTYSQRILRYMSSCCCFAFFCASCTEPSRAAGDANWRQGLPSGLPPDQAARAKAPQQQQQQQPPRGGGGGAPQRPGGSGGAPGGGGGAALPGVGTAGLAEAGYGKEASLIQSETRQQDDILDQISKGLDGLKHGALAMQDEIGRQDYGVERLHADSQVLQGRLASINKDGFRKM